MLVQSPTASFGDRLSQPRRVRGEPKLTHWPRPPFVGKVTLLPPFPPVQNPRVHLRFFGTMRFAFISLLLFASAPAWAADSIRQWSNQTLHFQYDLTTA